MTRLELAIAWRYLRSRTASRLLNFISVISIGGVLVGVSALIVTIAVMNGLQSDLREKILIGSPDIRVLPFGADLRMSEWRQILDRVKKQPGIEAAAPFVMAEAGVSAGHAYAKGAMVVGIEPEGRGVAEVTSIRESRTTGDFRFLSSDGRRRGAVVGKRLAESLNVFPGDSLMIVGFSGVPFNAALGAFIPKFEKFEVTGVFETGMYEYDNTYIYVALDAAQQLAGIGADVTGIEAKTTERWRADAIAKQLRERLITFQVIDWQQQNAPLFRALNLEKFAMGVILLLIVIVAAFNIIGTLTMVVRDKTREIGILKAMGMPARSIRRVFLAQGTLIGFVGTVLGLLLGVGTAVAVDRLKLIKLDPSVYFIDHLPALVQPLDVMWIVVASVAIAVAATFYPAMQAARLYPVEAIRYD